MIDKRKYSIFISSTYEDLIEERREILSVALENSFIPVGMEQFHAYPASQWDLITKIIDECDVYLLIIGGRYGSIDKTTGISYTEKEYDYAKSKGIPVLALLKKEETITQDKTDKGKDQFKKQKKLDSFRDKVNKGGNTTDKFGNIDELKYVVSQALKNVQEVCDDNAGWVRVSDIPSIIEKQNSMNIEKNASDLNEMQSLLSKFENKLEEIRDNQITYKPVSQEDLKKLFAVDGDQLIINAVPSEND